MAKVYIFYLSLVFSLIADSMCFYGTGFFKTSYLNIIVLQIYSQKLWYVITLLCWDSTLLCMPTNSWAQRKWFHGGELSTPSSSLKYVIIDILDTPDLHLIPTTQRHIQSAEMYVLLYF